MLQVNRSLWRDRQCAGARVHETPPLLTPTWQVTLSSAIWMPVHIPCFATTTKLRRIRDRLTVNGNHYSARRVVETNASACGLTHFRYINSPRVGATAGRIGIEYRHALI